MNSNNSVSALENVLRQFSIEKTLQHRNIHFLICRTFNSLKFHVLFSWFSIFAIKRKGMSKNFKCKPKMYYYFMVVVKLLRFLFIKCNSMFSNYENYTFEYWEQLFFIFSNVKFSHYWMIWITRIDGKCIHRKIWLAEHMIFYILEQKSISTSFIWDVIFDTLKWY